MTNNLTGKAVARIGASHGYRFTGDSVELNAELDFSPTLPTAARHWSLQLWASASGFPAGQLAGVKVAEFAVEAITGTSNLAATTLAMPPAGAATQTMALALVSCAADGQPELADLAVYAEPEVFIQPCLRGNVVCSLADGMASLQLDAITNPRQADNLSGTLALEVWALEMPYTDGDWQGTPVASVILGVLAGGNEWTACNFVVPAAMPASNRPLAVLLREWSPAGYVTRDYRNFPPLALPQLADEECAVVATPPVTPTVTRSKKASAKSTKKSTSPAKTTAKAAVAVNTASEAEMLALKGLSANVARAIIAGRPYASLDELCRAKGMGEKLLAKLREFLVL